MKIEKMSNSEIYGIIRTATMELENREQRRAKPAASSVEVERVEHEGLLLAKVNQTVIPGVYVRFNDTRNYSALKNGKIYGPVKNTMTVEENDYNVFNEHHNRTSDNVEVFVVVKQEVVVPEPLTANQQRAEVIQRAREFVNEHQSDLKYHDIEFVVNDKKRTVVALSRYRRDKKVNFKGIAKCHPNDIFHADIGKAIAIAKLRVIDIPQEFIDAVQPTKFAVGQITEIYNGELRTVTRIESDKARLCNDGFHWFSELNDGTYKAVKIIGDTNAIYEV